MELTTELLLPLTIISLVASLFVLSCAGGGSSAKSTTTTAAHVRQPVAGPADVGKQPQGAGRQATPEIEQQRKEAQHEAEQTLDKEAMETISQTHKAINAIAANKNDEALSAIEQATGKINILLARNPATALIPVGVEVDVIDTAPHDLQTIREVAQNVSKAVDEKNYPAARVLLYSLMSEIRARSYNLPLATYPKALQEAARLLDQKKTTEASNTLLAALNTLLVVDRSTPLPLLLAREAITTAQAESQKDKAAAQANLETAKQEVERAKELGYSGKDQEYAALNADISRVETQLAGRNEDVGAVFAKLKDRLGAFLKRQSRQQAG